MYKTIYIVYGLNTFFCFRYLFVLVAAFEARSSRQAEVVASCFHQQNDVSLLRLFEAFLESAPQLILQAYIIVATQDALQLTSECLTCAILLEFERSHDILNSYSTFL